MSEVERLLQLVGTDNLADYFARFGSTPEDAVRQRMDWARSHHEEEESEALLALQPDSWVGALEDEDEWEDDEPAANIFRLEDMGFVPTPASKEAVGPEDAEDPTVMIKASDFQGRALEEPGEEATVMIKTSDYEGRELDEPQDATVMIKASDYLGRELDEPKPRAPIYHPGGASRDDDDDPEEPTVLVRVEDQLK